MNESLNKFLTIVNKDYDRLSSENKKKDRLRKITETSIHEFKGM